MAALADAEKAEVFPLHIEGFCQVLHAGSESLLSAGADGKLLKVAAETGQRSWSVRLCDRDSLTSAAASADLSYLAMGQTTTSCDVYVCALDSKIGHRPANIPRLLARFTLPVRHLAWQGPLLGIGTDDGKLCLWNRETESQKKPRELPVGTSSGAVLGLAFEPKGELLAAAFASGALLLWGLQESKERHRSQRWPKALPGSERVLMAWSPDSASLALPGDAEVRLLSRESWSLTKLEGGHRLPVCATAWGSLLASASQDAVCMWGEGALLHKTEPQQVPFSLAWGENFLAVGNAVGSWAKILSPATTPPAIAPTEETPAEQPVAAAEPATSQAPSRPAEQPASQPASQPVPAATPEQLPTGEVAASPQAEETAQGSQEPEEKVPEPVQQLAFQPGASQRDPNRRYLAWNDHGTLKYSLVEARKGTKSMSSSTGRVVVDYVRRIPGSTSQREFQAPPGLAMGSLGPGVFAMASREVAASKVVVHVADRKLLAGHEAPPGQLSFTHDLPQGETVEALAVSRDFVAALTSPQQLLCVRSLVGEPLHELTLGGAAICLVATEDLLLAVTEPPGPPTQEPRLEYMLFSVRAGEKLAAGELPLSSMSSLRWCGFTAESVPLTLDTEGELRALVRRQAGRTIEWAPLTTLPGRGAQLWPVLADRNALHCAEVAKEWGEPSLQGCRLKDVRFRLPAGVEVIAAEKRQSTLAEHFKAGKRKPGSLEQPSRARVRVA